MSNNLDLCEHISQAIRGRNETWTFIRSFASYWVTPLEEGDGWMGADLLAAQERLGLTLPAAFKEAYTLFGRRSDLTRNQERLLGPMDLYLDNRALTFRHENQGALRWGILVEDLQNPDPPVYSCDYMEDTTAEKWEPWLGRFSLACIDLIMWESLHDPRMPTEYCCLDDEMLEILEKLYTKLPSPGGLNRYTPESACWFTGDDVLLASSGMDLFVRARSHTALESVRQNLPGDWLNE
ncbi:hypothetical protein FE257_005616 [Aspergillus nanangensis]|uniref:SMI1/KNR4 family protein n=1 Tax=Aspergillus nanangensis TaxID=2582783 RepID=A0AAD4CS77_ASPNN|nr:hypothetical protein FE257_005616 [Aspergillus nanangensis]